MEDAKIINIPPNVDKMKVDVDIEGLINALGYAEDRHIRWKAANALVTIGDKSENYLIKGLKSDDKHIRGYCAEILGRLSSKKAIKPLSKILKDDKFPDVRESAVSALGRIGGYKVIGILTDFIKDEDMQVRKEVDKALRKLGYY